MAKFKTNILYDIKVRTIFKKKKRQDRKYTWNYALVPLLYNKISVEVRVLPKSHFKTINFNNDIMIHFRETTRRFSIDRMYNYVGISIIDARIIGFQNFRRQYITRSRHFIQHLVVYTELKRRTHNKPAGVTSVYFSRK